MKLTNELKQYGTEGGTDSSQESEKCGIFSKACMVSHFFLLFLLLVRSGGTVASQLGTGTTIIFQLNTIRFAMEAFAMLCFAIVSRTSLLLKKEQLFTVISFSLCNICASTSLFFTASFWPVGNMEAIYVIMSILLTTAVDIFKKQIQLFRLLPAVLACIGVILLAQPWTVELGESCVIQKVPCEYWQESVIQQEESIPTDNNNSSFSFTYEMVSTGTKNCMSTQDKYYIFINNMRYSIPVSPLIFGYILLFISAAFGAIYSYVGKDNDIVPNILLFWSGIIDALCSLLANVIWTKTNGLPLYTFPTGRLCVLFVALYILLIGLGNITFTNILKLFNVSTIAISYVLLLLLLYTSQRTFLKEFHPGHANYVEVLGILTILCALLISPVKELFCNMQC